MQPLAAARSLDGHGWPFPGSWRFFLLPFLERERSSGNAITQTPETMRDRLHTMTSSVVKFGELIGQIMECPMRTQIPTTTRQNMVRGIRTKDSRADRSQGRSREAVVDDE